MQTIPVSGKNKLIKAGSKLFFAELTWNPQTVDKISKSPA